MTANYISGISEECPVRSQQVQSFIISLQSYFPVSYLFTLLLSNHIFNHGKSFWSLVNFYGWGGWYGDIRIMGYLYL